MKVNILGINIIPTEELLIESEKFKEEVKKFFDEYGVEIELIITEQEDTTNYKKAYELVKNNFSLERLTTVNKTKLLKNLKELGINY